MKPRPEPARGTRAVTSLQNERVKFIRALEMRKTRRETGLFVAEGASVLVSARDAGWKPRMLVFLAGSAGSGVHRGLLEWAEARRRRVPGGVRGRARQAGGQGEPSDHARRVRAAMEGDARPAVGARGCGLAGAGGHSRSGQPRHHHPHGGCRRRQRRSCWSAPAATPIRASPCGPRWGRSSTCRWCGSRPSRFAPGRRAGREMWSARTCPAARTSAPRPTGSLC